MSMIRTLVNPGFGGIGMLRWPSRSRNDDGLERDDCRRVQSCGRWSILVI